MIVTTTAGTAGDYTQATVEFLALSGTIDTPAYINVNGTLANLNGTTPPRVDSARLQQW